MRKILVSIGVFFMASYMFAFEALAQDAAAPSGFQV
jgi:hypothetical protein